MNLLKSTRWRPFFALLCAFGWSLAYPFIKLAYGAFGIPGTDTGSKVLLAGFRFLLAGIMVLAVCRATGRRILPESRSALGWILLFALVNTTLHYFFTFVGLGYVQSSRGTIIDSWGTFLLIILSCLIFADDHFTALKLLGCLLGAAGILLINLEPGADLFSGISFMGDGMILLNTLCAAGGGLITRVLSRKTDIMSATGLSMALGGLLLCAIGLLLGPETAWSITPYSLFTLLILSLISAGCFGIYNQLLAWHPISKIAIFNALIPVLGVLAAAVLLGEPLKWQYLIAAIAVSAGVALTNIR